VGVGDGAEDLQLLLKSGSRLLLAFPRHHLSLCLTAHTTGLASHAARQLAQWRQERDRERGKKL
jgi:hypothetical protein